MTGAILVSLKVHIQIIFNLLVQLMFVVRLSFGLDPAKNGHHGNFCF